MNALLLIALLQVPQVDTVALVTRTILPAPVEVSVTHEPVVIEVTHESLDSATMAALAAVARDAAMHAAGQAERKPTWERVAWILVGVGAVWVVGHGLNKIARAIGPDQVDVDVDVDVEGDEADNITINVPPPEPPPPPHKPPWGRGKGKGPG